jgi:hypothetical protein
MTATTPHDELIARQDIARQDVIRQQDATRQDANRPDQSTADAGIEGELSELASATSVHPGAIVAALAAYWVFIIAAWIAFGRGYAALDLTIVMLITTIMLGLLTGGAFLSRYMTPDREARRTFRDFVSGAVDIETGKITGRDALVQIAMMPILLAIGGSLIALIFFIGA